MQHFSKKRLYNSPTAIQVKAIPTILQGSDVMSATQIGIGKTIAFTVPIIHKLLPKKIQILMFSATFSSAIKNLVNEFLNNPQFISVDAVSTAV